MRIKETGQITDDFYVMGHPDVPVYLLDGTAPVLFDAGFTVLGPLYIQDIKKTLGNRVPKYLFFTHTHFDHIGSVAQFKKEWPELQIAGSPSAQKILSRPRAIETIRRLNHDAALFIQSHVGFSMEEELFEPFNVDLFVEPDQRFELSRGASILANHAPGHTRDFLAYWVPEKKILIASEAVGCGNGSGNITPEFLIDYRVYRSSLEALSRLDAQVLCPGHRIVVTGTDVKAYFRQSLDQASDFVRMVESFLREEKGDIEKAVLRVKAQEWDGAPWPKQPEMPYVLNTRERVKCIWKDIQGG
ncbi:MAG: MBL fold metallo-hydrolase [Deltaproteobacteria bacterium]|nr:MBL fold metallo-hydrolase [Deltaproteobacteria bacterium]